VEKSKSAQVIFLQDFIYAKIIQISTFLNYSRKNRVVLGKFQTVFKHFNYTDFEKY